MARFGTITSICDCLGKAVESHPVYAQSRPFPFGVCLMTPPLIHIVSDDDTIARPRMQMQNDAFVSICAEMVERSRATPGYVE